MITYYVWTVYVCVIFLSAKLKSFGNGLVKEALRLYPSSAWCPTKDRCPERSYTTMVSDIRVTCPNNDLAQRAAGKLMDH